MRPRSLFYTALLVLLLATGCAHEALRTEEPGVSGPRSIRATAIVELQGTKTVRGRAMITARAPDCFSLEIKGPLGMTATRIRGDSKGVTISLHGEDRSFSTEELRLPLDIHADELVALLLGRPALTPRQGAEVETVDLPEGRSFTVRLEDGTLLFRATTKDYREVGGFTLPFYLSIEDEGHKLVVRFTRIRVNPELKKSAPSQESATRRFFAC